MKLHFEPDLDYQLQAIEAVCDLFRGQETCRTEFTVTTAQAGPQYGFGVTESDLGIGNRLTLLDEELLKNLHDIQLRNGLPPSVGLESGDFTVEMETGTGKTYVYLRTIFEFNKRYGFTKFVIVVPSVAIKEGVYKSLQMTEDHFKGLYAGAPFDYFLYDSTKLGQVRNFATSATIQIMIVTVGAINKKDINNLYKDSEKTGGEKPIDLIKATRPILIVDEPQSVDGGLEGRGKEALGGMNPLCTLRYSATHAEKHHMVYRLDAVDAYERKLVKQIEVAAATVEDGHNRPYLRLLSTKSTRSVVSAKVEVDVQTAAGVRRQEVTVSDGDDLEQTTRRAVYKDCRVGEIQSGKGRQLMELRAPGDSIWLKPGQAWGDVDGGQIARHMIRRTIREHLDKEKRLRPQGIKVLSLFFIDVVDKYRRYEPDAGSVKGEYAQIFEDEYQKAAKHPDYLTLFQDVDVESAATEVHDGYFSIDRSGTWTDTSESNQTSRDSAERAYNLIMKEKEKLLSFDTPLKFIFSHSALREGWDNPNVFQICSLRDIRTERERRQTIGRGLRLCVNQDGQRVRGFVTNTLTVVATESYEEFAANLQQEIEQETGIRFGIVEQHQFAGIRVDVDGGVQTPLGFDRSKELWKYLKEAGYIDGTGKIQDSLRIALREGIFAPPTEFEGQKAQIHEILRKLAGRFEVKNADERRPVRVRQAVLDGAEFKALWERVRDKTTYRVHFDNEELIAKCVRAVQDAPVIPRTRLQWRKAEIAIGKAGVEATEREGSGTVTLEDGDVPLPDLLTELQDRTQLTRKSIYRVLTESGRLEDFRRNPQQFIEFAATAINHCKQHAVVDGIKYQRLGDASYYAQELFATEELTGYLKNMRMDTTKSVYEHVVYDAGTESSFAEELENNTSVKVYAKLPGWFTVPTPLGGYNPDWAVLVDTEEGERLYLVVETKGTLFLEQLRAGERDKIRCAKEHFKALEVRERPVKYVVAATLSGALDAALED